MRIFGSAILAASMLAACAHAPMGCPAGLSPKTTAALFFGRNIASALGVSEADWQGFVEQEIAPRFPDGFSVRDIAGQYRGPNGVIVREPGKEVLIVLAGASDEQAKLDALRAAYKARFRQDSVLLVETRACAGF